MKLQHFAIGARFEYEGKVFVKTGPLTATSEQGGQQMIPRYAMLKPLDLPEPAPAQAQGRRLDPQTVRQAFDTFYATCRAHCPPEAEAALHAARGVFLDSLR